MRIRILSGDDVHRAVPMARAIEVMKEAFAQLSSGEADIPLRTGIDVGDRGGATLFMPAYLRRRRQLGLKIVSVFPRNPANNLPTIHALVALVDADTGRPAAVMDGTYLTSLRTGAASGAATDLLAREDARVAAILGAGSQARTQLEGICEVRDLEEVRVYCRSRESAERFAREMSVHGDPVPSKVRAVATTEEALKDVDLVCTATTSKTPVFSDRHLPWGVHINAIGAFTPEMQEIPEETIIRARIVVDSREACWEEAGDLVVPLTKGSISKEHVCAELGEIAAGAVPGRQSSEEITLFKSVGVAVQDVAVAARALNEAARLELGTEIEL